MEFKIDSFSLEKTKAGCFISCKIPKECLKDIEQLQNKELCVSIKPYYKPRSINANAYFWKLCNEVACVIGSTKEEVYKEKIKESGVFEVLPIKASAYNSFVERWENIGVGWFCERMDTCKLNGFVKIIAYYGSSTYNTKEMARVIDSIVDDCRGLNIPTLSSEELDSLKGGCYVLDKKRIGVRSR